MIVWIPLLIGGLLIARSRSAQGATVPLFQPKTAFVPWSATPPSSAGSSGTGQTNPLSAFLGSFTRQFSGPAPYVPLSGPGGATTSPGASGAPSGQSANTLLAAAPGTVPDYSAVSGDLASLANPQFWWMSGPVDVAIMSEDVNTAMSGAAGMDLSSTYLEASMGMVFP